MQTEPQETNPPAPATQKPYWPKIQYRLLGWFGLVLAALWACSPDLRFASSWYFFPLGWFAVLLPENADLRAYGLPVMIGAYLFYLLNLVLFLVVRSKKYFYILLWLLIVVLAVNVVGCHDILAKASPN